MEACVLRPGSLSDADHGRGPLSQAPPARRRLQMHSCDACRRRKVRCDSVDERPCSACVKAGVVCRFAVGWRRRKDRRPSAASTAPLPDAAPARSTTSASSSSPPPSRTSTSASTAPPPSSASCSCAWLSRSGAPPPESEVALSLKIAENGLHRFFQDGLTSTSWTIFDRPDHIRVTYTGTPTSNMAHLIQLGRPGSHYLIYPYPQIRPPVSAQPGAAAPQSLAHDLLHDINAFPEKEIRDDFVDAYFAKVNPYFPVVDEREFRASYEAGAGAGAGAETGPDGPQPPLLLLHAVLLVGAHVSSHEKAQQARHVVKAVLFRRAKSVFDMRLENDRLHLVQAALLLTWHLQNGDTASANSYFWLGTACRIAFGLGMHRDTLHDPPRPDRMPMADRRLWRRIWWTLFQAEVLSALEHGRPCAIRPEDYDQAPLCRDDFRDATGRVDPRFDCAYGMANAALCRIALDVVTLSAPGVAPAEVERRAGPLGARLVAWMLGEGPGVGGGAGADGHNGMTAFGDANLRLHYNTVVIHLCRLQATAARPAAGPGTGSDEACHRVGSLSSGSMAAASTAAADIIAGLEALDAQAMLAQCSSTAGTACTAAAVQVARDTQQALAHGQAILAMNGLGLLDRACAVAARLAEFWPNVEGVRKVVRTLADQFAGALRAMQQGGGGAEAAARAQDEAAAVAVDWTEILGLTWDAGYAQDLSQMDPSFAGLDWG